jgi:hypothetical protein
MGPLIVAVILFLVAVIAGPIATIWALNTLFPMLAIPYDIASWAAVVIITGVLKANVTVKK